MKCISREIVLFCIGGVMYCFLELLYRGYTHWSMAILGGLCFVIIGLLNEFYPRNMPLVLQMGISAIVITILEFIFGVVLNIIMKLNVWDYSNRPFNLLGQICLQFSIYWFFLSFAAIMIDDYIRWDYFEEEFPHYKLF